MIIDFGGAAKSIKIDGNGGVCLCAGTISVTNGTSTVTGVGTNFTAIPISSLNCRIQLPFRNASHSPIHQTDFFLRIPTFNVSIDISKSEANGGNGVHVSGVEDINDISISDCVVKYINGSAGVRIDYNVNSFNHNISNTYIGNNAGVGILNQSSYIQIEGNNINYNGGNGITVNGTNPDYNIIKGNIVSYNAGNCGVESSAASAV